MLSVEFNPAILVSFFNQKVRETCRSCKRYGHKSTCPPYVESVAYYQSLLTKYTRGKLFIEKFELKDYTQNTWQELGEYSSKQMQETLFNFKIELINQYHFPLLFGAGSCKNCSKCSFPCAFPDKSLIPIEALGLNVVELVYQLTKIDIIFPVKDFFYRVGMVVWDD
jgi:predicted metal-binding protein